MSKLPAAAFAVAAAGPATIAPPPPAAPPRARPAPEPVTPREAAPGPVPYFAPVTVSVPAGYSAPMDSSPASKAPWGMLAVIALVLAVVGGGYFYFFGRSSEAFSPEDRSYSVVLPEGWVPIEEVEAAHPQIDAAVRSENNQSAIMVGHWDMPVAVSKEQLRAGMSFAQKYMPQLPGVQMGGFRESAVVSGDGVTAFEMTATATAGLVPGGTGKMRLVVAFKEGATNFALLVVACAQAECPKAEATFQQMTPTFEFAD